MFHLNLRVCSVALSLQRSLDCPLPPVTGYLPGRRLRYPGTVPSQRREKRETTEYRDGSRGPALHRDRAAVPPAWRGRFPRTDRKFTRYCIIIFETVVGCYRPPRSGAVYRFCPESRGRAGGYALCTARAGTDVAETETLTETADAPGTDGATSLGRTRRGTDGPRWRRRIGSTARRSPRTR